MEMTRASLSRLFNPSTIAIVGASASPEKPGYQMMLSLQGFPGKVYPVNPNASEIMGIEAYPDLAAIPEPVDLVALVVPPQASAAVLTQAAERQAGAALMISGGFGETGEEGRKLQDQIAGICREGGVRLLGPNTSGFLAPPQRLNATFLPAAADIAAGPIGIVAQSGGINLTVAFLAHADALGLSFAVGVGNAADVGVADAIQYLTDHEDTRAIALHLEGVSDGRRLFEVVREAVRHKPVIALPVGRSDLGGFAESHTGKLMGNFSLTRSALVQAGAVVVDTTSDLVDAAHLLGTTRLGLAAEHGIGILTGQAGPGLLMADTLRSAGVNVPEVAEETVEKISALVPPMTFIRNPVDTGRPGANFGKVLGALAEDRAIDAVVVYALLEEEAVDPVVHFDEAAREIGKPIIYATCGRPTAIGPVMWAMEERGIPSFASPDRAARAIRALAEDSRAAWRLSQDAPLSPAGRVDPLPDRALDEHEAKNLIEQAGIRTPKRVVCATHEEATAALGEFGRSVVVKVLDAAIAHKTEAGGVHIGIETPEALARALANIDAIPGGNDGRRYLIEEMTAPGIEIIIGGVNDASFGPTVLLGLGGTAAEALGDVARRLSPLGGGEAATMIDDLKGRALLEGWRGAPVVDRAAIADAVVKVGALIAAHPEIKELDLNPVRVYHDGLIALDALVVV